jgi:hypothetical protein
MGRFSLSREVKRPRLTQYPKFHWEFWKSLLPGIDSLWVGRRLWDLSLAFGRSLERLQDLLPPLGAGSCQQSPE